MGPVQPVPGMCARHNSDTRCRAGWTAVAMEFHSNSIIFCGASVVDMPSQN